MAVKETFSYKIIAEVTDRVIICNSCEKEFNAVTQSDDIHNFRMSGGYGSKFPEDLSSADFALCGVCMKDVFSKFKIPVMQYDSHSRQYAEAIHFSTKEKLYISDPRKGYLSGNSQKNCSKVFPVPDFCGTREVDLPTFSEEGYYLFNGAYKFNDTIYHALDSYHYVDEDKFVILIKSIESDSELQLVDVDFFEEEFLRLDIQLDVGR